MALTAARPIFQEERSGHGQVRPRVKGIHLDQGDMVVGMDVINSLKILLSTSQSTALPKKHRWINTLFRIEQERVSILFTSRRKQGIWLASELSREQMS